MKGYANPDLLVQPSELNQILQGDSAKRVLILDLRPPDAYAAGHIPGAIHLDLWGVSLIDTNDAPLNAFMWMIEHVLAVHGVDAGTPVQLVVTAGGASRVTGNPCLVHAPNPPSSIRVVG